jgi:hypothetical protein
MAASERRSAGRPGWTRNRLVGLGVAILVEATVLPATAELYSHLEDSTVVGRNFGYESGTPEQGHPPVGTVEFVPELAVFMENIEKIDTVRGRTFIGFFTPTRFRYRASEIVTVELGALLGHDFGDDNELDIAEPILRLVAEPIDDVYLVGGTILPTHWIHDALLDDTQRLQGNEQGFQVRVDRETLKLDTWVNWRIRETRIRPEEFEIGTAFQLRPDAKLLDGLQIDGQVFWSHVGGQQNDTNRVEHNLSFMGGGTWGCAAPFGVDWIEDLRVGAHYFHVLDDGRNRNFSTGRGWEAVASLDTQPWERVGVRVHASYFDGDEFVALRGDPLYRLGDYSQVGGTVITELPGALRLEGGVVFQYGQGVFNGSFLIKLVWGQAFPVPVLRPREPSGA